MLATSPVSLPIRPSPDARGTPSAATVAPRFRSTVPHSLPALPGVQFSARFREPRIGGDFFDCALAGNYLFLVMTDIAGERDSAERVAAEVQEAFRQQAASVAQSSAGNAINEPEAAVELLRVINGAIMSASGGVRCAPTFVAIYNLGLHLITYISAGAPAVLFRADGKVSALESSGIPLGLFTHLTHDPMPLAMGPGSKLVLVSKGVLEARQHHNDFGMPRVSGLIQQHQHSTADMLSEAVLLEACRYGAVELGAPLKQLSRLGRALHLRDEDQDMTVLTLARA